MFGVRGTKGNNGGRSRCMNNAVNLVSNKAYSFRDSLSISIPFITVEVPVLSEQSSSGRNWRVFSVSFWSLFPANAFSVDVDQCAMVISVNGF
jgi:hypothetical protein